METHIDGWSVTVNINGEDVLTIGEVGREQYLSGIHDVDKFAPIVRKAAEHLKAFVGSENPL